MSTRFHVRAEWHAEAGVLISAANIPDLNVEAGTLAEFLSIAEELAPAMLEANVPAADRPRSTVDGSPLLNRLELQVAA